ncbi:MAG: PAS domain S-box protein [Ginsengibacter sp.]
MPINKKVLVLENNEEDVTAIRSCLQKAKMNFEIKAVNNKTSYLNEIDTFQPDVILANHRVKDMDAAQALDLKNTKKSEIPFILVTDKVDELFAVKLIKMGAYDYLLKNDLSSLSRTIKLALKQAKTISNEQKKQENEVLQKNLSRNTAFLNAIPDMIFVADRSGVITDFKAAIGMEPVTRPESFLGKHCTEVLPPSIAEKILKNIVIVLGGGILPVHEYKLVYPDGIHDFEARYAAISENNVLAIVRDITLHKQAEQKVLKEKELSESLINGLPEVFYLCNQHGNFLRWNKNWEEISGYTSEDMGRMHPLDFFDEKNKQLVSEKISNVFRSGEDSVRVNLLQKSGKPVPYFFTGKRVDYEDQTCMMGIGVDLSELTLAQETLRKNEEKLRTLVEKASDGICIADENYQFIEVNNKFCKMLGYSREELLQLKMTDLSTHGTEDVPLRFNEIKQGDSTLFERYLERKDGSIFPVEISSTIIQQKNFLNFVRDITERKRARDLLAGEKEVMEMIATGKPLKEILHKVALNYESICDDTVCSILLLNKEKTRLQHGASPSLPEAYSNHIHNVSVGPKNGSCGTAVYRKERVIASDIANDPLWANISNLPLSHGLKSCWSNPIFDRNHNVLGTFGIFSTHVRYPEKEELIQVDRATNLVRIAIERHTNEVELKESEEKFRTLVERVSDAFVAIDNNWNYIYVNKKAGELLGIDHEYLLGKNIWNEFPEVIDGAFHQACIKAMEGQKQLTVSEYYPNFDRWLENNIYPSREGLSIYFRDVTERKLAEQKIVKSNRVYYFLSQFNQMIVYAGDEKTLFREACKIAVNIGKFRMAWVGIIDENTLDLIPLVYDGAEMGYLSEIKVKADISKPEGQGTCGMAITQGSTITCNDIETDPRMSLWKVSALKRNYHSKISLPIKKFGKVIGIFALYADTKNFFDEEEIALLEGATQNISFALEIIEKNSRQKKAEEELLKSDKQFQNLIENISGVYWVNNLDDHQTIYISPSYEAIWGRTCADHYKNRADFINAVHPDDRERLLEAYKNIAATLKTNITYRIIRPEGTIRWISAKTNVVSAIDGTKLEYGYAEDITERKMVESELAESENRLKTILQNEPECVKLMDEDGNLLEMNPAGLAMMEADNLEMIKGKKLTSIVNEPYREGFTQLVKNVFNGKAGKMEFQITGLKRTERWMETHAVPFKNADGKIISVLAVSRDITHRKLAEENEKRLTKKLLKGAEIAHFGFIDWNLITNEMNLSQQANEIFGIKEDQVRSAGFMREIVFSEDMELVDNDLELAKIGLKEHNLDHRIVWPDGSIRWVNTRAELYRDETGRPVGLYGTVLDITEQKDAELQIKTYNEQLRQLTAYLQDIREEERTRIGREIHDELGQQLTAIKMDAVWIYKNTVDKKEAITSKLKNIIELLDGSNQSVRKILSELRPAPLDNYGLPEAMEWHIKQFTTTTHIPVKITISEPDLKIHEDVATNVFRIFQESLTNIMRYAEATKVLVSLDVVDETINLSIEDDGVGFDIGAIQDRKTFGILGMRERARSLNGQFKINSSPGKGTKIFISLPYKK